MMQELRWDEQHMQGQAQPAHLAGSMGGHEGSLSGDAEQLRVAAVAAGSPGCKNSMARPGCSQEAGEGQAQQQGEEGQAASS